MINLRYVIGRRYYLDIIILVYSPHLIRNDPKEVIFLSRIFQVRNHPIHRLKYVVQDGVLYFQGLSELLKSARAHIGIKRMGEIDPKTFEAECKLKFPDDYEFKALELCSLWQEKLKDPDWYPFKVVRIDDHTHEVGCFCFSLHLHTQCVACLLSRRLEVITPLSSACL